MQRAGLGVIVAMVALSAAVASCGPGTLKTTVEPLYRGTASDENLHKLQDMLATQAPASTPGRAATLLRPAAGEVVTAGHIVAFQWENPSADSVTAVAGGCDNNSFGQLVGGSGLQPLHCPSVTGYVYWLQLDVPDHPELGGVLTTNAGWDASPQVCNTDRDCYPHLTNDDAKPRPGACDLATRTCGSDCASECPGLSECGSFSPPSCDRAAWQLITSTPGTINGRLVTTSFFMNDIDQGPYQSTFSFVVE
jgi:hypothetical protein